MASGCASVAVGGDPIIEIEWIKRLPADGKAWFLRHGERLQEAVASAQEDATDQLVPIMLAEGSAVPALRAALGRATWRKFHHASEATNLLRALVWMRFQGEVTWSEIAALPPEHLRSCRNAFDWPTGRYAAHHAPAGQFHKFAMLYRDVVKLGVAPKAHWTPTRLRRERDRLFRKAKIAEANPELWASKTQYCVDGFTFTLLCSDRALVAEGISMRHCVASYIDAARADLSRVFVCTGPERATLRIDRDGGFELRGFANAEVSQPCARAAAHIRRLVFCEDVLG
ncbi:MAG: hypothetical protein AAFQ64_15860 [Pseudomonadota bacterium]